MMRALGRLGAMIGVVLAVASSAAAATDAHYLVLTLDGEGKVAARYAAEVTLDGALGGVADGAHAPRRDADAVAVTLRGQGGRALYRDVVELPRALRGEFHGTGGRSIDGHFFAASERSFVVKVPASRHATLEIVAPGARGVSRIDVDAALADSRGRLPRSAALTAPVPLDGWTNGSKTNRVDVLVLGDGYTAAQEATFDADALSVVNGMFAVSPYHDYRNYVNAMALFTPSAESGADQPPYDAQCGDYGFNQSCCGDASAQGRPGQFVDSAFDASYCTLDIQRLLTVNSTKVFTAAAEVPDWDQILVIVNSTEYGGSGGGLSVLSLHGSAIQIAQHEYGHTFAALADEYASAYPGYPACSDVTVGAPACERNVTDETRRDSIKWSQWIDAAQAVPSSGAPPVNTDAGLWLGARYVSSGMYRQGYSCIMRFLGAPFCDVAAEAYAIRLYEGGWGAPFDGIDVIEPGSESPPPGPVTVFSPGGNFSAQVLGPVEGPALDVRWILDGVEVSTTSAASGETASYELATTDGVHSLQLRVTDVSPILHATTRPTFASMRSWDVEVGPPPSTTLPTTSLPGSTTTSTTSTIEPPTTTVTTSTTNSTTTTTLPSSSTTLATDTTTTTSPSSTTSSTLLAHPFCSSPLSDDELPLATDCLFILEAAVGLTTCTPECVCAPKGSLPVTATDALVCLTAAVGGTVDLHCPCGPFP